MRIVIDEERCTGHARCVLTAPSLFTDDERGYGQVISDGAVDDTTIEEAQRAVNACPEQAIRLLDAAAGDASNI